jgi:hypothetical protein
MYPKACECLGGASASLAGAQKPPLPEAAPGGAPGAGGVPKAVRKAVVVARPGPFVSATVVRGAARSAAPSLHAVEDPAAEKLHEVNAGNAARTQRVHASVQDVFGLRR